MDEHSYEWTPWHWHLWQFDTISDERTTNPFDNQKNQWGEMQRSITMVDNTWSTFFLCWVCSSTDLGDFLGIVGSQIES